MKTLAIGNSTNFINFAIFSGEILEEYGKIKVDESFKHYIDISDIVKAHEISFVVLGAIDLDNCKRRNALRLTKIRTIIKLICEQEGVVYTTPSTYGWDKFILGDKIQGVKLAIEKVRIINAVFDINLDEKDTESRDLANAIMLGSAFTQNKYKVYKKGEYDL